MEKTITMGMARVNTAGAFVSNAGFTSVSRPSTGTYEIVMPHLIGLTEAVIFCTAWFDAGDSVEVINTVATVNVDESTLTVTVFNTTTNLINRGFSVHLYKIMS